MITTNSPSSRRATDYLFVTASNSRDTSATHNLKAARVHTPIREFRWGQVCLPRARCVCIYSLSCCDSFGGAMASRAREEATWWAGGGGGREGKTNGASREEKPMYLLFPLLFRREASALGRVLVIPLAGNSRPPSVGDHRWFAVVNVARVAAHTCTLYTYTVRRCLRCVRASCASTSQAGNQQEREKRGETGSGRERETRRCERIHDGGGGMRRDENKGGRRDDPPPGTIERDRFTLDRGKGENDDDDGAVARANATAVPSRRRGMRCGEVRLGDEANSDMPLTSIGRSVRRRRTSTNLFLSRSPRPSRDSFRGQVHSDNYRESRPTMDDLRWHALLPLRCDGDNAQFTAFYSGVRTGEASVHHAARWDYVTTLLRHSDARKYSAVRSTRSQRLAGRGLAARPARSAPANRSAPAGAVRLSRGCVDRAQLHSEWFAIYLGGRRGRGVLASR